MTLFHFLLVDTIYTSAPKYRLTLNFNVFFICLDEKCFSSLSVQFDILLLSDMHRGMIT